ncbi:hypothetical protein SAMN05444487_11862 [Marininema mesophilum]|uniref:Uncharacterized protein n=1 Tax=Marininema mesophilum TaxID=1048340 RepID=A0A1H3BYJ9_9BACL|nr:hypothetical protein [Marininema mesophilum]SDX46279.1 hypothetical protein SAMN05444487_11862 [Marininema mesophilum]
MGYEALPFARIRSLMANPEILKINANVQVKYKVDQELVRKIQEETTLDD